MTLRAVLASKRFQEKVTRIGRKAHPFFSYVVYGDELYPDNHNRGAYGQVTLTLRNAIATDWEIRKETVS